VVTAAAPLVHSSRGRKIGSAKEAGWLLGGAKVKGYHPPASAWRPGEVVNEMAIVVPAGAATPGGVHVVVVAWLVRELVKVLCNAQIVVHLEEV
jgi:hypothetical protein